MTKYRRVYDVHGSCFYAFYQREAWFILSFELLLFSTAGEGNVFTCVCHSVHKGGLPTSAY